MTLFGVRAGAGATFDSKDDVELVGKSVDVQLMREGEEIGSCDQLRINHDDPSFTAPSLPISGGIGGLSIRLKVKHKHSLLHLSQSSAKSEETSLEDVLRLHEASAHNLCENDEMQSGEDLDKLRKLVGREFEAPWERALSSTHLLYRNQERGMRRMSATSRQGERKLAGTVRLFSKFDPPLFLFSGGFDVSGKVCDWQPIGGAVDDLDEDVVDINADGPWEEETAASAYAIYLLMMKALIADECPQLALPEQHILNSGMLGCNLATIQTHHHGVLTKSSSGQFKTDYTLSQHYGFAELSKTSVSMLQALAQWTNINDIFQRLSLLCVCAQCIEACVNARVSASTSNDAIMIEPYFYDMIAMVSSTMDDLLGALSVDSATTLKRTISWTDDDGIPKRQFHRSIIAAVQMRALERIEVALWSAVEFRGHCFVPARHREEGTLLTMRDAFGDLLRACRVTEMLKAVASCSSSRAIAVDLDACRKDFTKRLTQVVFSGLRVQYNLLKRKAIHAVGYADVDAYDRDAKNSGKIMKAVAHVVNIPIGQDVNVESKSFNVLKWLGLSIDAGSTTGVIVASVSSKGALAEAIADTKHKNSVADMGVSRGDAIIAINDNPVVSCDRAEAVAMLTEGTREAAAISSSEGRFLRRFATESSRMLRVTFQEYVEDVLSCDTNELADGTLQVVIERANDLLAADSNGMSDPYCVITVGDVSQKTTICRKTLNPKWSETFDFVVVNVLREKLKISVKDWDMFSSDDDLGEVSYRIADLMHKVVDLGPNTGSVINYEKTIGLPTKGTVTLKLKYTARAFETGGRLRKADPAAARRRSSKSR